MMVIQKKNERLPSGCYMPGPVLCSLSVSHIVSLRMVFPVHGGFLKATNNQLKATSMKGHAWGGNSSPFQQSEEPEL